MVAAAEIVRDARRGGQSVKSFLGQPDLFGRDASNDGLALYMGQNMRTPKRLGRFLSKIAEFVVREQAKADTVSMFGDAPVTLDAAIESANAYMREVYGDDAKTLNTSNGSLFNANGRPTKQRPAEAGSDQPDAARADAEADRAGSRGGQRDGDGRAAADDAIGRPAGEPAQQEVTGPVSTQSMAVAQWVRERLNAGEKITSNALFTRANEAWGGKQSEGAYTSKDGYDALELGVNLWLLERPGFAPTAGAAASAPIMAKLQNVAAALNHAELHVPDMIVQ